MKTLSYINAFEEEIEIGQIYYFGQLWDGDGDGLELLQSGSIAFYNKEKEDYDIIEFELVDEIYEEDVLNTKVKIIDVYWCKINYINDNIYIMWKDG